METEGASDPRLAIVAVEPSVAPDLPGHLFAYAYRPVAGANEQPHLFVPLAYPTPSEREVSALSSLCDHCGQFLRRQRFVVLKREETGGRARVSEGCLADYLGSPVAAAMLTGWIARQEKLTDTIRESMPLVGRSHFSVREVIATALDVIAVDGWVSRGQANQTGEVATASIVLDLLEYGGSSGNEPSAAMMAVSLRIDEMNRDGEVNGPLADEIVNWLRTLHRDEQADIAHPLTDYLHNLALVASMEYVEARSVGLLCSAPSAYRDHLAQKEHAEKTKATLDPGKHFGLPDSRVEADVFVDRIENRGENEYGVSLLVHLHVVPTGERLKWWTGEGLRLDEGKQYKVRMTVKKHGEWDGVKETTVSRVSEWIEATKSWAGSRKPAL